MIKILFICHGNICRSPMAEFVYRDLVKARGLGDRFIVASAATSREEIGNPVHYGTKNKLKEHGISTEGKCAVRLRSEDYWEYDYLIGMEERNITNMLAVFGDDPGHKVYRLLDFTENPRDIADPWYTGNFELTYDDVLEGCEALLQFILQQ